jgi:Spy/CpxP family protein refolding chaperone
MYPGMLFWWMRRRRHGCGGEEHAHGGHSEHGFGGRGSWQPWHAMGPDDLGGGAFGVRRPLRFLAWKLELDEEQVAELARILDELKTERAQAAVDDRRTSAAFADAVVGETFAEPRANEGAKIRVDAAQRLRDAVVKALGKLHALLRPDQRQKLAYLIRTGALSL